MAAVEDRGEERVWIPERAQHILAERGVGISGSSQGFEYDLKDVCLPLRPLAETAAVSPIAHHSSAASCACQPFIAAVAIAATFAVQQGLRCS